MNDFLQSLRNGQAEKPRTPKTRKHSDNSYHYTSPNRFQSYGGYQNSRNQQMKRPPAQHPQGNQAPVDGGATIAMLAEAIENLNNHIETLAQNQDYLVIAQQKTADMIERQTIAIERILDHFDITPGKETAPEPKADPKKIFQNHYVTSQKPKLESSEPVEPVEPDEAVEPVRPVRPFAKTAPAAPIWRKKVAKSPVKTAVGAPVKSPVKSIVRKRKKIVVKKDKPIDSTDNKLLSREAIMKIIETMRSEGSTFDQVANHLVELGQPTFSGRGEWHAQTIHRLCSKK